MPPDQPLDISDFIQEFYVVAKSGNHSQENLVKFGKNPKFLKIESWWIRAKFAQSPLNIYTIMSKKKVCKKSPKIKKKH